MTTSEKMVENFPQIFPRVEIVESESLFKDMSFNEWESHAILIHKPDGTHHIGGLCSEKYSLVKNEDVFLPIADKLDEMFGAENINFSLRWSKPFEYHPFFEMPHLAKGKDALYPMCGLTNSYTTKIPASQMGMVGRVICTNGLMTIEEKMQVFKIKHTKKETQMFLDMDQILKDTETVFENFEQIFEVQKAMNDVRLSKVKGANQIERFEAIIKGTTFPKKQIETALNIAQNEAKQLKQDVTLWLAYNALNHILWHDKEAKMTQKVRTDIDQKLINKVHKMAIEMA